MRKDCYYDDYDYDYESRNCCSQVKDVDIRLTRLEQRQEQFQAQIQAQLQEMEQR
ncbi:MAG: hypothetical protein KID02_11120 [Clostridiales bacterium]|nr:hypothetical protein [Clostridiales bacterium]